MHLRRKCRCFTDYHRFLVLIRENPCNPWQKYLTTLYGGAIKLTDTPLMDRPETMVAATPIGSNRREAVRTNDSRANEVEIELVRLVSVEQTRQSGYIFLGFVDISALRLLLGLERISLCQPESN